MAANQATAFAKQRSDETKRQRGGLRLLLKQGFVHAWPYVASTPDFLARQEIGKFLLQVKGLGPSRVRRILNRAKVSEVAWMRDLTPDQRHSIVADLKQVER